MTLTEDDKNYTLQEHLKHISCIADKEYQKRVWINGEGPQVDSFEDTVCDFFTICDSMKITRTLMSPVYFGLAVGFLSES